MVLTLNALGMWAQGILAQVIIAITLAISSFLAWVVFRRIRARSRENQLSSPKPDLTFNPTSSGSPFPCAAGLSTPIRYRRTSMKEAGYGRVLKLSCTL